MSDSAPAYDDTVLGALAKFVAGSAPTDDDVLSLMILFHTHTLMFRRPILPERPKAMRLCPLTQREAADIAAQASPHLTGSRLYWLFNTRGSFEIMDDVPSDLASKVDVLRAKLLSHPDIAAVEEAED